MSRDSSSLPAPAATLAPTSTRAAATTCGTTAPTRPPCAMTAAARWTPSPGAATAAAAADTHGPCRRPGPGRGHTPAPPPRHAGDGQVKGPLRRGRRSGPVPVWHKAGGDSSTTASPPRTPPHRRSRALPGAPRPRAARSGAGPRAGEPFSARAVRADRVQKPPAWLRWWRPSTERRRACSVESGAKVVVGRSTWAAGRSGA